MVPPPILVVCLCGVFCLSPLALYLFWMGIITRRDEPTVISGRWDFVGLVAGLSGFILFGGGLVLSLLQSNFRYWMRGNFEAWRAAWGQEKNSWMLLSIAYSLFVISAITLALAARRRTLVIYNADPTAFEATMVEVFEHLGRPIERKGNLWIGNVPLFELERFEAGRTVTLRWLNDDRLLHQEVERLLREAVSGITCDDNPASRWIMACAGAAGFWAACSVGLYLVYLFSLR